MSRSVLWIKTGPIPVEKEAKSVSAAIIYNTGIHADMRSLREGVTCALGKFLSSTGNEMMPTIPRATDVPTFKSGNQIALNPFSCCWRHLQTPKAQTRRK